MGPTPPDFNQNSETNGFTDNGSEDTRATPSEPTPISVSPDEQERIQNTSQQLRRIFLILVGVGASVGLVLAIALVIILNRFGLVGTPQEAPNPSDALQQLI